MKTRDEQISEAKASARKRIDLISKLIPPLNDTQRELLVYLCTEMYFQGRVDMIVELTLGS